MIRYIFIFNSYILTDDSNEEILDVDTRAFEALGKRNDEYDDEMVYTPLRESRAFEALGKRNFETVENKIIKKAFEALGKRRFIEKSFNKKAFEALGKKAFEPLGRR